MKLFETRYRIVRDRYAGYQAQFRPSWSPFWHECFGVNTTSSIDSATRIINRHKATRKRILQAFQISVVANHEEIMQSLKKDED